MRGRRVSVTRRCYKTKEKISARRRNKPKEKIKAKLTMMKQGEQWRNQKKFYNDELVREGS